MPTGHADGVHSLLLLLLLPSSPCLFFPSLGLGVACRLAALVTLVLAYLASTGRSTSRLPTPPRHLPPSASPAGGPWSPLLWTAVAWSPACVCVLGAKGAVGEQHGTRGLGLGGGRRRAVRTFGALGALEELPLPMLVQVRLSLRRRCVCGGAKAPQKAPRGPVGW